MQDAPVSLDGLQLLLSRESATEPPQTYTITYSGADASSSTEQRITDFPHPYPQLKDMQKEVLRYKRSDGVDLTGTLYLPPGYDAAKDGPLPTILWAYPREYKSKVGVGVHASSKNLAQEGQCWYGMVGHWLVPLALLDYAPAKTASPADYRGSGSVKVTDSCDQIGRPGWGCR